jgi:hypothetical protein
MSRFEIPFVVNYLGSEWVCHVQIELLRSTNQELYDSEFKSEQFQRLLPAASIRTSASPLSRARSFDQTALRRCDVEFEVPVGLRAEVRSFTCIETSRTTS